MEQFLTWEVLLTFSGLVGTVYMGVEFTKEMPLIKKIKTQYWSWIIAFVLLIVSNLVVNNFKYQDILLHIFNAMAISLSANGLHDFNKKNTDKGVG